MHWMLAMRSPSAPTREIEEAIQAQARAKASADEAAEAVEGSRARLEAAIEKTRTRSAQSRGADPRIRAARDALKLLERH